MHITKLSGGKGIWLKDIVNRCPSFCDSTHDLSVISKTGKICTKHVVVSIKKIG